MEREYRKDVDNIVNDLPHENMFEICLKNIIIPLPQDYFAEADSKKHRYASAKALELADTEANFERCSIVKYKR